MYRQYEDPYALNEKLKNALAELEEARLANNIDWEISVSEEIENLRERIDFAWQDIEYDECY